MTAKTPLLGPVKDRVKTDIWIGKRIRELADLYSETLDVPRNVVFSMALALWASIMSPILKKGGKRKTLILQMQKEVNRIFDELKKQA